MRVPSPPKERGDSNLKVEVSLSGGKVPMAEAVAFPPGGVDHFPGKPVAVGMADQQCKSKFAIITTKVFVQGSVVTMSMCVTVETPVISHSIVQSWTHSQLGEIPPAN